MKADKRKFLKAMQARRSIMVSLVPARQHLLRPDTAVYKTPVNATNDIVRFAKTINADETLEYVPFEVWPASVANYCTANVHSKVAQSGGTAVNGWSIWTAGPSGLLRARFLYAEAHVIWRSPEGKLVDITPRMSPFKMEYGNILFLPDASVDLLGRGFVEGKTKILDNADAADVQNYLDFVKDCFDAQVTYWKWLHTLPPESEIQRLYLKHGFDYPCASWRSSSSALIFERGRANEFLDLEQCDY